MTLRYQLVRNADGRLEMTESRDFSHKSNDYELFSLRNTSPPKKKFEKLPKYCVFCKKAGFKYDDHNMRKDGLNDGEIICDRIKNSTCTSCGLKGHTKSYCSNLQTFSITKKPVNKSCEYCINMGLPNRIASMHQTYEDPDSQVKKITCPLMYFHNFDLEKNSSDDDLFIVPKQSDEPDFSSTRFKSRNGEVLSSSQESNITDIEIYNSLEYSLNIRDSESTI